MEPDRKFLRSLIEVSHIEFQSYDFHRQQIIFSSGVTQHILGYSKDEFYKLGRNFYEGMIHPDDIPMMREAIEKIIHSSGDEVIEMTARYRKADGNYIWLYTRKLVSERDKDGNPCTITTVAEDVTEMIRMQDELREKVQQLELISYKNSHLIRSPVSSIIGLINLIEVREITSTHNLKIFTFLKQAIEKLDNVIREINDLCRE
jgi:PAS domain S-box-containing protein